MDYQAFADKLLSRLDRLDRAQIESFVARLLREFRLYENLLDRLPDGVVLLDPEGRVLLLNAPARRILDLQDSRRGPGETWRRALRGESYRELRHLLERHLQTRAPVENEPVVLGGKTRVNAEITVFPLAAEPGEQHCTLWLLRDTGASGMRRDEHERARYVEFMTTLTAGLAHEIRNPLNSLAIHATLLDQGLKELPASDAAGDNEVDRLRQSSQILNEEIQRLNHIVDQFLTAARPLKLDRKPTRVETLFAQIANLLGPECRRRAVDLTIESDPDLPPIPVDPAQMYQVLLNLAKNAVEAVDADGRVVLRSRLEGDHALIEVSDTGRGIPETDRAKIFEPYYSTKKAGSGLGLMVVWRIVKAHGGAIAVDSRVGEGATFSIALPLDTRPVRLLPGRDIQPEPSPPVGPDEPPTN